MFTKQWTLLQAWNLFRTASGGTFSTVNLGAKDIYGNVVDVVLANVYVTGNNSTQVNSLRLTSTDPFGGDANPGPNYSMIIFGSGDTPAAFNDYTLDNRLSTTSDNLVCSDNSFSLALSANEWVASYNIVVKNNGSESKTIKEVGVLSSLSTSAYANKCILVYREVLQTPITIEAGSIKTVHFEIRFPTNVNPT